MTLRPMINAATLNGYSLCDITAQEFVWKSTGRSWRIDPRLSVLQSLFGMILDSIARLWTLIHQSVSYIFGSGETLTFDTILSKPLVLLHQ